jgi:DNA-binding winged helix-turn-helix (wHTH) protein
LSQLVRLGAFTFDGARACLHGPSGDVALRHKSFEVLRYLVDRADRVVSKNELVEGVWSDVIVGDDSLAQCVTEIRRALGRTGRDVIKTVPRRGAVSIAPHAPFEQRALSPLRLVLYIAGRHLSAGGVGRMVSLAAR